MTKQDRPTLKSFFRSGALPSEKEYSDFIDSTVNMTEDGFAKTDEDGLQIPSKGGSLRIVSLYQGIGTPKPNWVLDHGKKVEGALHIRPDLGKHALTSAEDDPKRPTPADGKQPADEAELFAPNLTLTRDGRMGVSTEDPAWRLDVGGVARMKGRVGVTSHEIPYVKANGKWHAITQPLTGCHILEVVAGAGGKRNDGRYSLLHAVAMNAYHPRNPLLNWWFRRRSIKAQRAVYGSFSHRLRLRWVADKDPHTYRLEICTNANLNRRLEDTQYIRYSITRLWFDTDMAGATMTGKTFKRDRDRGLL